MRVTLWHRGFTWLALFTVTFTVPTSTYALRNVGLEESPELREQLKRELLAKDGNFPGGSVSQTSKPHLPAVLGGLEERVVAVSSTGAVSEKRLGQWADHFVGRAFDEQRAFEAPQLSDTGVAGRAGGFINAWAEARQRRELAVVLSDPKKAEEQAKAGVAPTDQVLEEKEAAARDLQVSVTLVQEAVNAIGDAQVKQRLAEQTRFVFVLEPALPNLEETGYVTGVMGFPPKVHSYYGLASPALYEEGDVESDTHRAVVAVAGTFPYEVGGQPVASPRSMYLSVARLKRYAQLSKEATEAQTVRNVLVAYLEHLDRDLEHGQHQPWTPPADLAAVEQNVVRLWQAEREAQRQAWAAKDAKRVTETFVSVNLARALGSFSQIPEAAARAAEQLLEPAKRNGTIKDYIVLRIGDHLLFDVTHQRGAGNLEVRALIRSASSDGLAAGWEALGFPTRALEASDWNQLLDWHEADWRYTERASQPTIRQVIVGGSPKASDGILYDLYASPAITTQQAIEGTHGTYYVVQNTEDPTKGLGITLPGGETNKGLFDLLAVGKTSNHATRAIYPGKGSRFPLDEPHAVAIPLGTLQLVVYNSQAGSEAICGITGPATSPRIVDGTDRRLSLKPVTLDQAPSLTSAMLQGQLAGYAPTILWGSQMFNNGEFDQIIDPVAGADFPSKSRLAQLRDLFAKVLLGQGETQPFLKTEEANRRAAAAYERFKTRSSKMPKELEHGTLTVGVFKADIGSALGHTEPPKVFMAVTRAVLEHAKQTGLIKDYLVKRRRHAVDQVTEFRVGDDIELQIVHDRPIGDPGIHGLAWRAFWAAGWVLSDVLNRKPYGLMQDLPNAKDLDAWVEAAMTPETLKLILQNLKVLAVEDARAIDDAEVAKVEAEFHREYKAQQAETRQRKAAADKAKFQFTGNVKGSGIGSAEGGIAPGAWSILAFDKASPGAFSVPFMKAAAAALAAGVYTNLLFEVEKVRPEYDAGGKEIEQSSIILDFANLEDRKLIQSMLGAVNEFQIKAIRTRDTSGAMRLVAVNSTDRLYQVTVGVYVGKDDPVSFLESRFASFVFQWMQTELFITEGDERGSHWAFVLPVPMDKSSPGKHSIPIAVGLNFTVTQAGQVPPAMVVDVFDDPAYDQIRAAADDLNHDFIRAVGNFGPRGDAASVEATYPLWQNLARITDPAKSPHYALTLPVGVGLEEAKQAASVFAVFDFNAGLAAQQLGLNALVVVPTLRDAQRQLRLGVAVDRLVGVLSGGLEEADYQAVVPGMRHFVQADTTSTQWQQHVLQYASQFGRRVIPIFTLKGLTNGLEELGVPLAVVERATQTYARTKRDLATMY